MSIFDHYNAAFASALGGNQNRGLPRLPALPGPRRVAAPRPAPPRPREAEAPEASRDAAAAPPPFPTDQDMDLDRVAGSPESQAVAGLGEQRPMTQAQGTAPAKPQPGPRAAPADVRAAIEQAAKEAGIDPTYAIAVASRESDFNPTSGGFGSIRGLYQMSGELRKRYGVPEGNDTAAQTRGFLKFTTDLRNDMASRLGRQPTDPETYMGHYFGGGRAARMIGMDPNTPVSEVFTPTELHANPNFGRAGTIGVLMNGIRTDMTGRLSAYGGAQQEPGVPTEGRADFSDFAEPNAGTNPAIEQTEALTS